MPAFSEDRPIFSRTGNGLTEIRPEVETWIVQVLDGVSAARRTNRTALVCEILREWALLRLHEASLIERVTRGNPDVADIKRSAEA